MRIAILSIIVVAAILFAALRVFETIYGARMYSGPVSDHFDGRKFHNVPPFPDHTTRDMFRWTFNRKRGTWHEWVSAPYGPKPVDRVPDGAMRVTFINHATVLLQVNGINILTDPVWSDRVGPVSWAGPKRHRPPGIRFEDLPPIDIVLISHNHYDHMDVPTLQRLADTHHPRIFVGLGNRQYLNQFGVTGVQDVDWGDTLGVGNHVRIVTLPSRHWSARARNDKRNTLWCAYAILAESGNAYFAGDTGYGEHFAVAEKQLGPFRLALLPIGAYLPAWFMARAHENPAEAVQAARDLKAATSIPIHYGTFELADDGELEPVEDLKKVLKAAGNGAPRFLVLEYGAGTDIR